ncbi:MAG: ExbD/TolR family protein [Nitrospinota bacterium]|nr:ExbD/TolR family protein [Nitrospinota bacterium]
MIRKKRPLLSEINVTPFVDVMLVLLVIFMITAPLMQHGMEVQLPKESTAPVALQDIPTITLKSNRKIYWNQKEMSNLIHLNQKLEKYRDKHKDAGIYFRADKALDYGFVMRVMSSVKRSGIQSIGMITEQP